MKAPYWSDAEVTLHLGDCLEVLAEMAPASVDAVVTDPPYNLSFMAKPWDGYDGQEDAGFAYWLSGLIDGEGHFAIKAHTRGTHAPMFALKMRADEHGTLEMIRRKLGVGSITEEPDHKPHPTVRWNVQDKAGCQRLVDLLDKYPLRAKKLADYWTWREAVCEWTSRPRGNRWHGAADNSRMAQLRDRLMAGRAYSDVAWSGNEFQDWCRLWAAECLRVLKPGGHMLAFGGTRTWHRLACAIEDAGFEVRDSIHWIYGSGFPKSLDVSKAIDKAAGAQREVIAEGAPVRRMIPGHDQNRTGSWIKDNGREFVPTVTAAATGEAARWQGWGTALKPAHEPIIVARKPLSGTVAANILEHGTGALNIDACRVASADVLTGGSGKLWSHYRDGTEDRAAAQVNDGAGRWPSNIVLTHSADCVLTGTRAVRSDGHHPAARGAGGLSTSGHAGQDGLTERKSGTETVEAWACAPDCPVAELDRQSGVLTSGANPTRRSSDVFSRDIYGDFKGQPDCTPHRGADSGGASRFFPVFRYEAKAGAGERPRGDGGTAHPTVKPVDLMRWLVRLVTPPGGLVLDCFAGSGTTAEACIVEGFRSILIEKDPAYAELIRTRLRKPIQPDMFGGVA